MRELKIREISVFAMTLWGRNILPQAATPPKKLSPPNSICLSTTSTSIMSRPEDILYVETTGKGRA